MQKPELSKSVAVSDNRGVFSATELGYECIQTNVSYNTNKYTFRGMHLQSAPHAQSKMVKVVNGSITDIIVDLREDSEDYMVVQTFYMEKGDELLVPKGFANGFITMEDHTVVQYLVDYPYTPAAEVCIHWKSFERIEDIFLKNFGDIIISDKDKNATINKNDKLWD